MNVRRCTQWTHWTRWTALLLAAGLLFSGCGKGKKEKTAEADGAGPSLSMRNSTVAGQYDVIETETALTGVYREAERFVLDDGGFAMRMGDPPFYDPETGTLTVLAERSIYEILTDENGEMVFASPCLPEMRDGTDYRLYTLGPEGEVLSHVDLPMEKDRRILLGVVTAEGFLWLSGDPKSEGWTSRLRVNRCGRDGEGWTSADLPASVQILGSRCLAGDREGAVILSSEADIYLLKPDLTLRAVIPTDAPAESVGFLSDGTPAYSVRRTGPVSVRTVNGAEGTSALYAELPENGGNVIFAPGAEYYYQNPEGVRGATDGEDRLLLNRQNSGLGGELSLVCIADPENFLYAEPDKGAFSLLRHAEDVELSPENTLTVVMTGFNSPVIEQKVLAYNQSHPEMRVVLTNLAPDDDWVTATDRLSFNLVNGFYQPDIIVAMSNHVVADTVLAKNLYVDLLPYMEKDPLVNPDNLFAAAKDAFRDRDGGIWGIAPYFYLTSLMGRRDVLGEYADGWTMEEFLRYAETLPEDRAFTSITQERLSTFFLLLGNGYLNHWIDYGAGEADFTSEDFAAFLRFVRNLPKNEAERNRRYPFFEAEDAAPYADGWISVDFRTLNSPMEFVSKNNIFRTWESGDLVAVGYPMDDGRGKNGLSTEDACIITKYCKNPDAAWDLIRTFFEPSAEENDSVYTFRFTALKSTYALQREELEACELYRGNDSDTVSVRRDAAYLSEAQRAQMEKTGVFLDWPEGFFDWIEAMLDEDGAVLPIVDETPDAIVDIVLEEISSYLGRDADEADCARKIQSRVSIWLAERQ